MASYLAVQSAFDKTKDMLGKVGAKTGFGSVQYTGDAGLYPKIAAIMNIILGLVGILAAIYVVYCGIKWMRSGGNEETVKEAKQGIKSALYGLIVIFGGYVIVNFVIARLINAIIK